MRWYERSCLVVRTPAPILESCSPLRKQARCSMRAIARLHPEVGRIVDELEAPWNLVRQIAHAPGAAAQWERAHVLLAELVEKRVASAPRRASQEAARLKELRRMAPSTHGGSGRRL